MTFEHISLGFTDYKQVDFYKETIPLLGSCKIFDNQYPPVVVQDVVQFQGAKFCTILFQPSGQRLILEDLSYRAHHVNFKHDKINFPGFHIAFTADSNDAVDNWYHQCLRLGATDNGPPGPRPHYGPHYYGAFVIDPLGYHLEACVIKY